MMRKCSSATPGNNGIMREDHATKHDKNCSELHCGIVFCFKKNSGRFCFSCFSKGTQRASHVSWHAHLDSGGWHGLARGVYLFRIHLKYTSPSKIGTYRKIASLIEHVEKLALKFKLNQSKTHQTISNLQTDPQNTRPDNKVNKRAVEEITGQSLWAEIVCKCSSCV